MSDEPEEKDHSEWLWRSIREAMEEGTLRSGQDGFIFWYEFPVKVKTENRRANFVMTPRDK